MSTQNTEKKLYDLLSTHDFQNFQVLDSRTSKPPINPQTGAEDIGAADMFTFDWTAESGNDYGTVVILLTKDNSLTVYFGDNLGKSMESEDKSDWFDFLSQLKQFATKNFKNFAPSNLNQLKYSLQGQSAIKEGLFESWAGRRDVSWNADATQARLMIKHKKSLGETDARFRYIDKLFLETAEGERFKLPFRSLTAGKAMLEHVRQGGRPYDIRGQHISEMVQELNVLSRFRRAHQGQIFEGDTATLVEEVTAYQEAVKHNLKSLTSSRGYTKYFESWKPEDISDASVVIEGIKHLFVTQSIDTRIESALPLLAKIQQQGTAMKEANIFEAWANNLMEGTWDLPDTPEKQAKLLDLMSQEFTVGADATNATEQLYDVFGDDVLFDQLEMLAKRDPDADCRQVIYDRMQMMSTSPEIQQVLDALQTSPEATMNPAPEVDPATVATGQPEVETPNELNEMGDVMFKDQERLDRLENLRSFAKAVGNTAKAEELDRQIKDIYAANPVGSQDKGHLEEFAPSPERDDNEDEVPNQILKLANRWWNAAGDQPRIENVLRSLGWSIHQVESEDDAVQLMHDDGTVHFISADEFDPELFEENEDSPVAGAITRRILMQRSDLLKQYGPALVTAAIDNVADYVGDVDEIGSSDVSGWINEVERMLKDNPPEAFNEEQVNELSPATLKSYIKKAGSNDHENSAPNLASRAGYAFGELENGGGDPEGDDGAADDHKAYMRSKGIARAVDKLEELSPDTLKSYVKKASSDRAMRNFDQGVDTGVSFNDRTPKFNHANDRKDDQRRKGIHKAVDRLEEGAMKDWLWKEAERLDRDAFVANAGEYGMSPEEAAEWWDSINGVDEECTTATPPLEESTVLQGKYGHQGKMQTVKTADQDILDRIKFLSGTWK